MMIRDAGPNRLLRHCSYTLIPHPRPLFLLLTFHAEKCFAALTVLVSLFLSIGIVVEWEMKNCYAEETRTTDDFFESRIRPLLIEKCVQCHGEKKEWASLRLDHSQGLMAGGESGPVVVPGDPEASELFLRVATKDESARMPPEESGPPLSEQQIDWLRTWIQQGAPWPSHADNSPKDRESLARNHWAFQPRSQPKIPSTDSANGSPSHRNPIDAFILEKFLLQCAPLADRRTLLRRLTYDTTGLPPDYEQVEHFEQSTDPDSYSQHVDRLLESPEFGEHWARLWLDIARYSDTKGYVYDREEKTYVHSSLYRDWVVSAFQSDMPYDRFVELQLAADRYAEESPNDLPALGFLTLGRRFLGVAPDIIDDRIDVVGRGLLGLTIGCSRCHDHKYDPIPASEYYALYGIFQNCSEQLVALPHVSEDSEFEEELNKRKGDYKTFLVEQKREAEQLVRDRIADYLLAQRALDKYPDVSFSQITSKADLQPAIVHRWEAFLNRAAQQNDPLFLPWLEFTQIPTESFADRSRELCQSWKEGSSKIHPRLLRAFAEPPDSIEAVAQQYAELFQTAWKEIAESEEKDVVEDDGGEKIPQDDRGVDELSAFRNFFRDEMSPCLVPDRYMSEIEWIWDSDTVVKLWKKQGEIDRWILRDPYKVPHALILSENSSLVEPRIFRRGNPAMKGDTAPRRFPEVFLAAGEIPIGTGSGRWELARAIVHPENPLTARVWVNRVWLQYFGKGLVTTPSDFGVRATPPSHPELLDWLASEFIRNGWSSRWLHRTILLSETYQRSSQGPEQEESLRESLARDPENRLLWRMNPKRLTFEGMRDSMLAASGELVRQKSGRSTPLFGGKTDTNLRRSLYGSIDRQFMPTVLSVFDVAHPDMHAPMRNETVVPQQALFYLNHPFVAARAAAIVERLPSSDQVTARERITSLYRTILQRNPSEEEVAMLSEWIASATPPSKEPSSERTLAWSYGYGEVDHEAKKLRSFTPLPYATETHWQGGPNLPDGNLGWVHITNRTIHSGNDSQHSAILRWTAPEPGTATVRSVAEHPHPQGDGVRATLISSREGIVKSEIVAHGSVEFHLDEINVEAGDTIDFIVERHETLSYEDANWAPGITLSGSTISSKLPSATASQSPLNWDASKDFKTQEPKYLTPWEQLTQILLISNEAQFVD